MKDVLIVGTGVAGATAAYALRDFDCAVIEREAWIGGRTKSVKVSEHLWYNVGAQYVSEDKVTALRLADEVGVGTLQFDDSGLIGHALADYLDKDDVKEIREISQRLKAEQRNKRPADDPSLDQTSFADWLGDIRPNVKRYWHTWCSLFSGRPEQVSLYGALLMHGLNRVTPFDEEVPIDARGNSMIVAGTAELARGLLNASGADISCGTEVILIEADDDGAYRATLKTGSEVNELQARRVVVTSPTVFIEEMIPNLPDWKCRALNMIEYTKIISTPIVIGPAGTESDYAPSAALNPSMTYSGDVFPLRLPTDMETVGTFYFAGRYDGDADAVWGEPDEAIRTGVYQAFCNAHPELKSRILEVGLQRWPHALPRYTLGRMGATPDLQKNVGGIHFAGDYTDLTHTEGAARSGLRVAAEIKAELAPSSRVANPEMAS